MPAHKVPTETLQARGSWRSKGREGEPVFAVAVPECPSWVPVGGREWFAEHAEMAAEAGYMSIPMTTQLAIGAHAFAEMLEMDRQIAESGPSCVGEKGAPYQNPLVAIRNKAIERLVHTLNQFGFTPAAKSGVKVGTKGEKKVDDKRRLFKLG